MEDLGERAGFGMASSVSGLLSGEWCVSGPFLEPLPFRAAASSSLPRQKPKIIDTSKKLKPKTASHHLTLSISISLSIRCVPPFPLCAPSCFPLHSQHRELLYSPEDVTRSSPFFWAFRRAFPDESDRIFSITDSIPSPLKEVGPAIQNIALSTTSTGIHGNDEIGGDLISRIRVATLGGMATSVMTTRCTVIGSVGLDGIRLRVDTTLPEESTVLDRLGPLGDAIRDSAPPFPSGEVLEKVRAGSSEVVMRTTYCDEGLRISRNDDTPDAAPFVWRRVGFGPGNGFGI